MSLPQTLNCGWGKDNANRLLLDTHWDGTKVTGTINSGGATLNVTDSTFDYSDPSAWKVTLKAEGKDKDGKPVTATLVGALENIGVYYKIFSGTITQGTQKGAVDAMQTRAELYEVLGYHEYERKLDDLFGRQPQS